MSIASELQDKINAKAAIKTAIEAKGVMVVDIKLNQYAAKIDEIQQDPSIPVGIGQHLVTFYDFDGKVLKRQRVNTGEDATAPDTPVHQYLTFAEWNNPFTNVQSDIDTGAIYNTTDGKTYLFITLTPVTGLEPTLYFSKSSTSLMTIDWGDGTTSTSTTSGNQNINHVYAIAGDYIITVDNSAGGTYYLGNNNNCFGSSGVYMSIASKAYMGANLSQLNRAFQANFSLQYLSTGYNALSYGTLTNARGLIFIVDNYGFSNNGSIFEVCYSLKGCVLKHNSNNIGAFLFSAAYSIDKLILPDSQLEITLSMFQNCFSLKKINCKNVKTVNSGFFNCGQILEMIFLETTPPTLTGANFPNINPICKIYVPDASVEAYKAATNWVTYANYIYPLSEKPQSDE